MSEAEMRDQEVRLADLVADVSPPIILRQRAFTRCRIIGPGVVLALGSTQFRGNTLSAEALWTIEPGRSYEGGIGVEDCLFEDCTFENVGLAGTAEFVARFLAG